MPREEVQKSINLGNATTNDGTMTDIKTSDTNGQQQQTATEVNTAQLEEQVSSEESSRHIQTAMVSTIANPLKNIVASILSKSAETCEVSPDMCEEMYQNRVKSQLLQGIPSNPTNVQQGFVVEKFDGEYYLVNNATFDIDAVQTAVACLTADTSYKVYQDGKRVLTDVEVQYIQYLSEGKLFMAKTFDSHGELVGYAVRRA